MNLHSVETAASERDLFVMGACHPEAYAGSTLVLLGAGPKLWPRFTASPEYNDGGPHPLDRWSKRVIHGLAPGHLCLFPSDGPPYAPFIAFALQTGQFHQSPTGMMVHTIAGLMVSIRGAVVLNELLPLPASEQHPCMSCPDRPCVSACPVGALTLAQPYDVPACKEHVRSDPNQDCSNKGCATRNVCPISRQFDRAPQQNAFHMRAFMGVTK